MAEKKDKTEKKENCEKEAVESEFKDDNSDLVRKPLVRVKNSEAEESEKSKQTDVTDHSNLYLSIPNEMEMQGMYIEEFENHPEVRKGKRILLKFDDHDKKTGTKTKSKSMKRPPIDQKIKEKVLPQTRDPGSLWIGKRFVFIILCIVGIAIALPFILSETSNILEVDVILSNMAPELDQLPHLSARIIRNALKAVSSHDPKAPAIILLLATEGAEERSLQLGKKLASAISPNPLSINGAEFTELDYNAGKMKIDHMLKNSLQKEKYDSVLVEDLHLIPGKTALMFHTYWDHENAPFKRVVYVITVPSGTKIKEESLKLWDVTVNKRLDHAWRDIDEDQKTPLLARLTVGVAVITMDKSDLSL